MQEMHRIYPEQSMRVPRDGQATQHPLRFPDTSALPVVSGSQHWTVLPVNLTWTTVLNCRNRRIMSARTHVLFI